MMAIFSATGATLALCVFGAGPEAVTIDPAREARQPQVAVDPQNRVFVAYGKGDAIFLAVSTDGGPSFASANPVGSVPSLSLGMRRGPRVAATGSSVVVAAVGGTAGKGQDGDVLAWRSIDLGKTWSQPVRVNSVAGSAREGLHAMAAGPKDSVFCAWLDLRNKRTEIYGAGSTDGGRTWGPDRLVYRSPEKNVCECCHPSVAFAPDGTLSVMWRNSLNGSRDLYLARSTNGGASFSRAEKLGLSTWKLNGCPMDGGAIATGPDGRVATIWRRNTELFLSRPGEPEQPLGPGVQPWITMGPSGPVAVWLKNRPGPLIEWFADRPGGPTVLAESANDPSVGSPLGGKGPVVAAWEDAGGGGIRAAVLVPPRDEK